MKQSSWSQCCTCTGSITHMMHFAFCECLVSTLVPSACMCSKNAALIEYLIFENFIEYFKLKLNDWPFEYLTSLVIMHKIPAPMQQFYTKCCNIFTQHTTLCIPTLRIMAVNCKTIESSSVLRCTHQHGKCRLKYPKKRDTKTNKEIVYTFMAWQNTFLPEHI